MKVYCMSFFESLALIHYLDVKTNGNEIYNQITKFFCELNLIFWITNFSLPAFMSMIMLILPLDPDVFHLKKFI